MSEENANAAIEEKLVATAPADPSGEAPPAADSEGKAKDDEKPQNLSPNQQSAWDRIISRREQAVRERDEKSTALEALEERGIIDGATADRLIERAQRAANLEASFEDPESFLTFMGSLAKEHPDSYDAFGVAIINAYLEEMASDHRKAGREGEAEFLQATRIGAKRQRGESGQSIEDRDPHTERLRAERASFAQEKLSDFDQRVHEEIKSTLHADIEKLIGDAQFPSGRQRNNFYQEVRNELAAALERDAAFQMDSKATRHPKHGLDARHRGDVAELYVSRARKGGLLAKTVAEVLKDYGVTPGKRPESANGAGKREVLGGGGGQIPTENREAAKAKINKEFAEGKIDATERRKKIWQLPPAAV